MPLSSTIFAGSTCVGVGVMVGIGVAVLVEVDVAVVGRGVLLEGMVGSGVTVSTGRNVAVVVKEGKVLVGVGDSVVESGVSVRLMVSVRVVMAMG